MFIPFYGVPLQQRPKLVLKVHLSVMFRLVSDVSLYLLKVGRANREIRITTLPLEIRKSVLLFQPQIRNAFQFLHPFRLRDRTTEAGEQVDVILHATHDEGRTLKLS